MSQPEERETVAKYFLAHPPGRILDIPSGNLWLSKQLMEYGFECHAADLYSDGVESSGISFTRVDMNQTLPFSDRFFDYIACIEGIEHMENAHHLLREFARILKPEGKVMITTPNVLNFKSRLRYMLRGTFFGFPHVCRDVRPGEHLHINPVGISELQLAARRSGLRIEHVHPFPIRSKNWAYAPGAWFVMLYTQIGLLMKKQPDEYRQLLQCLASRNVLLSDVLIVSMQKVIIPAR